MAFLEKVDADGSESVLALLRAHGPMPMAQLSEVRGVSRTKTGHEVAELSRLGLLTRGGRAPSRGGRPSSIVRLSDRIRYAGIDLGATSISVAITDGYLDVLDFVEEPADVRDGPQVVLARAVELLGELGAAPPGGRRSSAWASASRGRCRFARAARSRRR